MASPLYNLARERVEADRLRHIGDDDLVRVVLGADVTLAAPISTLAWASANEIANILGISRAKAARLAAVFELGRRGAWDQPRPGVRCLDPATVSELMRDVAAEDVEEFHIVLLDVRGRLLGRRLISRGSLSQCPVSPRDVLRAVVREAAHGVVFVHNHPSGDPTPSPDDHDLTERLRAAAELVGVVARDHVIVASGGYYSWVEAGRWRR
ncbi:JAB domain-containing protein [Anaeromyxobacter sp. SG26]|uniref:JAB domain-containing protein n=1 Tax=Anaeromyxobacter sp. SG26 TaxID=2925407 RepID=UPI001F55B0C4|nr:JAB domain-containing protein [Anaeromyxobacter sp. SG26]